MFYKIELLAAADIKGGMEICFFGKSSESSSLSKFPQEDLSLIMLPTKSRLIPVYPISPEYSAIVTLQTLPKSKGLTDNPVSPYIYWWAQQDSNL